MAERPGGVAAGGPAPGRDPGSGQARGTGNRARLDRSIREFEGLLWNQVLQQMSRVRLGPDGTTAGLEFGGERPLAELLLREFAGAASSGAARAAQRAA